MKAKNNKLLCAFILSVSLSILFSSCTYKRLSQIEPFLFKDRSLILGSVKVLRNGDDVTQDVLFVFSSGHRYQPDSKGYIAIPIDAKKRVFISKIVIRSLRKQYRIPNLILWGTEDRKNNYFGHININIHLERKSFERPSESLTWDLEDRAIEAQYHWANVFPEQRQNFDFRYAERIGSENRAIRSIASESNAPSLGL